MPNTIMYLTQNDAEFLKDWINAEEEVAWIILESQERNHYNWKAVNEIQSIPVGEYCLWRTDAGPLRIPSGSIEVSDEVVNDPFKGWEQELSDENSTTPWLGIAPESFTLSFRTDGKEARGSIGRSDLFWVGNRYHSGGMPASKESKYWWTRANRFIKKHAKALPWPDEHHGGNKKAYAFPEAYKRIMNGTPRDVNP